MTPLARMPSSLLGESRRSLEWYSIPRPDGSVTLQKKEENNQKNMIPQRTPKEEQKVWGLLQF